MALRLLLYHGLRKAELQAIQFKHFEFAWRQLIVFGKGGRVDAIPLDEAPLWNDWEHLQLEWEAQPDDFLMCVIKPIPVGTPSPTGQRRMEWRRLDPDRPMSSTALHRWWGKRLEQADVPYRKMHSARHTAGQRILAETGDLKLTQLFLRHADIGTTGNIYTHYDVQQQRERISKVLAGLEGR